MRLFPVVVAGVCFAGLMAAHAQQPVATIPLAPPPAPLMVDGLEVLPVQGNVHMISGAGGCPVVAETGDGAVAGSPSLPSRRIRSTRPWVNRTTYSISPWPASGSWS